MTDDRSERLRKRRKQSTATVESRERSADSGPTESAQQGGPADESEAGTGDRAETADSVSIKDEQVGTYMYLPESQTKELRRLYNVLKAEYEFEYDEEFEKNRHFYPLVVQYGLDGLDGLDASEIRGHLDEIT